MAPQSSGPKKFADLGCLSRETVAVLTSLGFHTTTPVQEATIPLFCGHKDVAVDACTGSGKTLAFVLPVIERLRSLEESLKVHQVGAIIISPTRELAKQIYGVAEPFVASVANLTAMLLVGGTDPAQDVATFKARGGHLLVGTPGRIEDILKRCAAVDLRRLEVLVLDEADRLLDMGFKVQLDAVMARLPKQRRTGLFSATQTEAVQELARAGLRNPVRVNVAVSVTPTAPPPASQTTLNKLSQQQQHQVVQDGKRRKVEAAFEGAAVGGAMEAADGGGAETEAGVLQKTPNSLSIQYVMCEADEKITQLVRFLRLYGTTRKIIVYVMTCAAVDHLALVLPRLPQLRGLRMRALHGRMKQAARERELEAFRQLSAGALLCTDLAARGLDIPDVHWIVQLDAPQDPSAFVHRVGRTARMGRQGSAVVYLQPHEEAYVDFLRLRKVPIAEGSQLPPTDTPPKGDLPAEDGDGDPEEVKKQKKKKNKKQRLDVEKALLGNQERSSGEGLAAATNPTVIINNSKRSNSTCGNGVPHSEVVSSSTPEVLSALRSAAERDREVMEKATRAFVTYVRGYKEHHCKFIFRLQDLSVGRLARGLGLLRLPKMPDLKKPLGLEHFIPSSVDPATVPYKDKAREKQRLKALQQRQEAAKKDAANGVGAVKRKGPPSDSAPESRLPAAKRRQLQQIDEAANLNAEYSLLKKLKKGKITSHQYDVATGLSSDSEAEEEGVAAPEGCGGRAGEKDRDGGAKPKEKGREAANQNSDSDDDDGDSADGEEEEAGGGLGRLPRQQERRGGGETGTHTCSNEGSRRSSSRGNRGQKPLGGVQRPHSVLQSYIDKMAKKKKKKKKKQHSGAES